MLEQKRFDTTWLLLSQQQPRAGLFAEVLARYQEPTRHYHNSIHIQEALRLFDQTMQLAEHPREVELAIWFHDAIYDPKAKDNEEQSAAWAVRELNAALVDQMGIQRIESLILATKHSAIPVDQDARLLVDIDLSILGTDAARFEEYDQQIRSEYEWVPLDDYRRGRSAILQQFLERPTLYQLSWFQDRFEQQARLNLTRAIQQLQF